MCKNDLVSENNENMPLGWLKLFIIGKNSNPTSRTVYLYRDTQIFAVLHTDTTGATKTISLPAKKYNGSEYSCVLDNGDTSNVRVYPFVINVHYIDKNREGS